MKKLVKNKAKKGKLFWITGLSGSGKTTLSKKITPYIRKRFGPTLLISGDDMRDIFNLEGYDKKSRLSYGLSFNKLSKFLTDQGINVIFNVIGMYNIVRKKNRSLIKNYIEIYIESELSEIERKGIKKIYRGNKKNIVGRDIKPQLPKSPDVVIKNDFTKNTNDLAKELIKKIESL